MRNHASLLDRYSELHPSEAGSLTALADKLGADPDICLRSNMAGHLTGSVYIVNPQLTRVLMIDHLSTGKILQPGGHLDQGETVVQGALRETVEETGIEPGSFRVLDALAAVDGLIDIDTHAIAARPLKGEGPHVHHDFAFLRIAEEDASLLTAQVAEVAGLRWMDMEDVATMGNNRHERVIGKIRVLAKASLNSSPDEPDSAPGMKGRLGLKMA